MFSRLLVFAVTGITPVAIVSVAVTTLNAPPAKEYKQSQGSFTDSVERNETKKQQLKEDKEHDDCQDRNIKVVIQNSRGDRKTVSVKELSQYRREGYQLVEADYEVGKCSRKVTTK